MPKSKSSSPAPPKITFPGPTAEEKQLQQQQIAMMQQMMDQGAVTFSQGQEDRNTAMDIFSVLQGPQTLDPEQKRLAKEMSDAVYNMNYNAITQGTNKEVLDANRADTLAALAQRGVINSDTASQALASIEKERMNLLDQAGYRSGIANLNLQTDFLNQNTNKAMGLFQTLYSGGQAAGNIGTNQLNSASNTANSILGDMQAQRLNAFNVQSQNAQAQYLYDLRSAQAANSRGGVKGALTGGLGGAGVGFMVGGPWGAAIGAGLGAIGGYF